MQKENRVSIIILNWDGKELLERCLPSVLMAVGSYGNPCEIMVVDNNSRDSSIEYLKINYPKIKILPLGDNFGFAKGMNIGIKEADSDIVVCLNNDVIIEKGFILPLISHFELNSGLFSVAAKMLLWDGKTLNFAKAVGRFRLGIFRRTFDDVRHSSNSLYSCGGAFAVDRNKFLELEGFDEGLTPFWEDLDLCYRAWKRGYKTIYEPASIAYHKFHGSFSKKFSLGQIQALSAENYFLFVLKNFHDRGFFYQQLLSFPFLGLAALLSGKPYFCLGLFKSIKRWRLFLEKRKTEKKRSIVSDRQVLFMANQ